MTGPIPTAKRPTVPVFESETCSRCSGCGRHSYCQMYGDTCFKCGGRGVVLTKRGLAAQVFFDDLCSVPASEIVVGDLVWFDGRPFGKAGFFRVESIEPDRLNSRPGQPRLMIHLPAASWGVAATDKMRKGFPADEKRRRIDQALAYQATLTKTGKPRKRIARAP